MEILYCYDIEVRLSREDDDDSELNSLVLKRPFYDFFIISHDNKALIVWNGFDKFSRLISTYFYLYMASFLLAGPNNQDFFFFVDILFEAIFFVSMLLEFITDFKTGNQ